MSASNSQLTATAVTGSRVDLYAVGLSTLCLIHCLALPLLVSLIPVVQLAENELVHQVLMLLAAPASLWVVWKSLPIVGSGLFIGAALSGVSLLMLAAFIEPLSAYEEPMTVIGALLLASAHLWRWARHRSGAPLRDEAS